MFAQVIPGFQNHSRFTTLPVIYKDVRCSQQMQQQNECGPCSEFFSQLTVSYYANPTAQALFAISAIAVNILVITILSSAAKEQKKNPLHKRNLYRYKRFQACS
jgi:hypothetical protein